MLHDVDRAHVTRNAAELRRRIDTAAADRDPAWPPVGIVGVAKTFGPSAWGAAQAIGCVAVGESYAQELVAKLADPAAPVPSMRPPIVFIGQLQSNKVRTVAPVVDRIDTVDRASLAVEIARRRPGMHILVQVRPDPEPGHPDAKGGVPTTEVGEMIARCVDLGLVVDGLMTIGPTSGDPRSTEDLFARTRALVDAHDLEVCSMGMSADLDLAVRLGATEVRIGTALFGRRTPAPTRAEP